MECSFSIAAERGSLAGLRRRVREAAEQMDPLPGAVDELVQAVDECAANIILYGYQGQPGSIEVELHAEDGVVRVRLRDRAPLFDPTFIPPPDLNLPIEQRAAGGLGIFLARRFVDTFTYRVTPSGENELTLAKRVTQRSGG